VALSDWEHACLGDGLSDLFWSQGTVRLIGFAEVLRHYEQCMAQRISTQRLAFAALFAFVKKIASVRVDWLPGYHFGKTRKLYALSILPYVIQMEDLLGRCIGKNLEEAYEIATASEKSMYVDLGARRT
jgi:hypothetical protein